MAQIVSGAGLTILTVDTLSNAARVTPYKTDGSVLWPLLSATKSANDVGVPMLGTNDGVYKTLSVDKTGKIRPGWDTILFREVGSSTGININNWNGTSVNLVANTIADGTMQLNSTNLTTASSYYLLISPKRFAKQLLAVLTHRSREAITLTANVVMEFGFGTPITNTPQVQNGAFFRKDSANLVRPVYTINNVDIWVGADISALLVSGMFYMWGIVINDDDITYYVMDCESGNMITTQSANIPKVMASAFSEFTLPIFKRIYWGTTIPTVSPQFSSKETVVVLQDTMTNKPYSDQMCALNAPSEIITTTQLTAVNWVNSTAPSNATLSNTAPSYTTKGGWFQITAVGGSNTDFLLFSYQVEPGNTFYCTGVNIDLFSNGATGATQNTVFVWGLVSDNPGNTLVGTNLKKTPLGIQATNPNAAIGSMCANISKQFQTPLKTNGGRYVQIMVRIPVGTATASQLFQGTVTLNGYNE